MRGTRDVANRRWTRLNLILTSLDSRSVLLGLFENGPSDTFAGNACDVNNNERRIRLFMFLFPRRSIKSIGL